MLKVGIIGAGRIGRVHSESISKYVKGAEIKAISDVKITEELTAWAKSMGIPEVYDDYKKILQDPEIDAVLVCSSTNTHAPISIEAAQAGKHVFCEKPVDADPAKIREVLSAVEKAGVKFQVGFNRRFDHNFKAIKDRVAAGDIGEPHVIRVTSRDPEAPPIEYVKVSGGMFFDMTIHDFDMIRYLSGSEVEEVFAVGTVLVNPEIGKAGDIDTAVITLKLKNGAIGVIDNSRKAAYGYDQRAEVFGSKGAIHITNDTGSTAVFSGENGVVAEKPKYFFLERYMQSFADEISCFVDSVVNDKPTLVNGNDGLQPVLIALAAKKSLEENRPVKLSEVA
ncbi:TPA: inositol 2-dehydrogenase [Mannheimia haemolytica]|uniref:Inositol 2-dehydrogenase n=1 Tax=Mannheimia haemolytica TaxID=75985 RepID=A0A249A2V8_MANHA|nr:MULTISPECIES: inositol 2-dehydrogenase [Pasteurellaceae]AWW72510.1 inositol 2-dehydrogenase [Pasteurellaceae bacterium 12565]AGI33838.1 inositol 2-dehydrogenase [Mannheimia haemolytica USDA-ARS-USMARC-183]AGI34249.1 inositol 2-dehydrogenase [Mannheimia haemolytica USDA-ARS-USMARC-185]AGK01248.1 putative MviM-like oxidoreductase [Mannheimia haemolytica M42548]AGQ25706.1 oxidoreductase [Mannheimia haemolytica D153]